MPSVGAAGLRLCVALGASALMLLNTASVRYGVTEEDWPSDGFTIAPSGVLASLISVATAEPLEQHR